LGLSHARAFLVIECITPRPLTRLANLRPIKETFVSASRFAYSFLKEK